jgi:predicted short-subunit dehydrogenase-like oxidoreductase (DUF2520 family)
MDDIAAGTHAAGFLDVVSGYPEDRPAIDGTGREQAGTFRGSFFASGRFCHGNNIKQLRLPASASRFSESLVRGKRVQSVRSTFSRAEWRKPEAASAMLPGMRGRPRIAIVGAGNFATALALSLRDAEFEIEGLISRSGAGSLKKARRLARKVGARAWNGPPPKLRADLIWFCVPDAAIARAARSLAGTTDSKLRVALHSSGALTSDELRVIRERGVAVASVHPLMTFVKGSRPSLAGVSFAIEGDAEALRLARRVVKDLGGTAHSIRKEDKAAYHAWGTFASPLFTALLATTEQVAAIAGVDRKAARRRMLPILRQTLANYAEFGGGRGFGGPIARGDVETVQRHLQVLRQEPLASEVYVALARAAVQYLPAKNKAALKQILAAPEK